MNNVLEELKNYFKNTPREKILSDWAEAKLEAPSGAPLLKEFMEVHRFFYKEGEDNFFEIKENIDILVNPEETSGFLFN